MFKHILIPTNGSAGADIAVQASIRFAKSIGARVTGLHVIPPSDEASPPEVNPYLRFIAQCAREHGVACDVAIAKADDVAQAIFQAAFDKQCDLITIAAHGRADGRDQALGRGAQEVLARSQVPVLVFR